VSIQKIVQKQKQKQPRGAGVVSVCPGCVCVWFGMILESFRSFSSFGDRQGVEVWYRTVSFQQVAGRIRGERGKSQKWAVGPPEHRMVIFGDFLSPGPPRQVSNLMLLL
jgi:hypothetical protein